MSTLFVSDLHLDPARPAATELFGRFLDGEARGGTRSTSSATCSRPGSATTIRPPPAPSSPTGCAPCPMPACRYSSSAATAISCSAREYARRAGMAILPDPAVAMLHGEPTLLLHGDLLCTDDGAYQQFRADPRSALAGGIPRAAAGGEARVRRAGARREQGALRRTAGQRPVRGDHRRRARDRAQWFKRYGVRRMIHGHTHRPAILDEGGATPASCSATGTNRDRCCGWMRMAQDWQL